MITSQQMSLLDELRQVPIPRPTLIELEATLQHRIHSMLLEAFGKSGLSQKQLADRLGWDESRVSKLLGSAHNLTLKTISALLAAIGVDLDDPSYTSFDELERRLRSPARVVKRSDIVGSFAKISVDLNNRFSVQVSTHLAAESQMPSIPVAPSGRTNNLEIIPPTPRENVVSLDAYRAKQLGENPPVAGERHVG